LSRLSPELIARYCRSNHGDHEKQQFKHPLR
jgi:hypothetical protein